MKTKRQGLVLTGGGARGAYQAGVLDALGVIATKHRVTYPFDCYVGNSAGAINAAWMVANAAHFSDAANRLRAFWNGLTTDQIFRVDGASLLGRGARWIWELSTGGLHQRKVVRSLLDTTPLFRLIHREIEFGQIQKNVASGLIQGFAVTAVDYTSGNSRTFHDSAGRISPWSTLRRDSVESTISAKHILASSAIPLLFPPVRIDDSYFGDGSLRNYTPMSPAVHLGAEKLMILGVRALDRPQKGAMQHPSLGRILSVILNFILLDAIDFDFESLTRVNELVASSTDLTGYRSVSTLMLRPSIDLGEVALDYIHESPALLKYLLRGLGTDSESSDLVSYLLFEPGYLNQLSQMGFDDTMARDEEIVTFFKS